MKRAAGTWGGSPRGFMGGGSMRSAPTQPYLDRISVIPHKPDAQGTGSEWRKLLIQPVSIPSLEHTGILTAFDPVAEAFVRPDGKVHNSLKEVIQTSYRSLKEEETALQRDKHGPRRRRRRPRPRRAIGGAKEDDGYGQDPYIGAGLDRGAADLADPGAPDGMLDPPPPLEEVHPARGGPPLVPPDHTTNYPSTAGTYAGRGGPLRSAGRALLGGGGGDR